MLEDISPRNSWRITIFAFLVFFSVLMAGFLPDVGREMNQREEFSYPDNPVWQASDRAEEKMPEESWLVFQIVMGSSVESEEHNVLDSQVFREATDRHDSLMADNETSQYFDVKFNWLVQRDTTSGIWGMPETVRDIMDATYDPSTGAMIRGSPIALPPVYFAGPEMTTLNVSQAMLGSYMLDGSWYPDPNGTSPNIVYSGIAYTGPNFDAATDSDLTYVLNALFNIRSDDGSYPYRNMISPDLCVLKAEECVLPRDKDGYPIGMLAEEGEQWKAKGLMLVGEANATRLYADYPRQRGDHEHYEYWEQKVDQHYQAPLESDEDVSFYSYLAFGLELDRQVNSTLPLVGVSFVLMVCLLSFYFRDLGDVLVSGLSLGLLMVCMFANSKWLGFPDTQLSAMLPILMLALGVDFVIHSLTRWRRLALSDSSYSIDTQEASINGAWETIITLFPALGVATLTTVVAFGTATLSEIPDLYEWGILGPLGIIEAYFIMGVFAPVLRSYFPPDEDSDIVDEDSILYRIGQILSVEKLSLLMEDRSIPMLVVFLLLTLILSPIVLGNPESTFDVTEYADNDSKFIQTVLVGQNTFTEQGEPGYYVIEGENLGRYEVIMEIDAVETQLSDDNFSAPWLGSLPYIIRTQVTLAQTFEGSGYAPSVIDPVSGIPLSEADIHHVLEDVYHNGTRNLEGTFHISPSQARETYLLENGKLTMVRVWFQVLRPDDMYGAMKDQKKDLDAAVVDINQMDGVSAQVAGLSYERYVYVLEITDSFQESLVVAIILAFFIVLVALRDIKLSIITIMPVVAITIWLRGGMVLTDTSINLVTVQISSLAIGLGVDYAIHMVQRVREARAENPHASQEQWMSEALDETGNNVAMSAFTDFVGFMVLTLSIMPLFVTFGMIMAIMIMLSFIAAVIMLPALLYQFGDLEGNRPPSMPSSVPESEKPIRKVKKIIKRRNPNPN